MIHIKHRLAALFSLIFSQLAAQDFHTGYDAFRLGDYATALEEWIPLAEQGNDSAQLHLGFLYHDGNGVQQDYGMAVRFFRLAAVNGNHVAQGSLGNMYQLGEGVLQDYVIAHMWFNISAANGWAIGTVQRDTLAVSKMTYADISKAQALARECISSGYQHCGY